MTSKLYLWFVETEEEDWEDSYPPPEEPDTGPFYTSEELWREVGTVHSRGLLDDLLEASARRHHAKIAKLLLETRTLLRATLERYCRELTKYVNSNKLNKKQLKEAEDAYNVLWSKERDDMTAHMRQIVSAEEDVWKARDEKIRQWVQENLKATSLLYPSLLETTGDKLSPPL